MQGRTRRFFSALTMGFVTLMGCDGEPSDTGDPQVAEPEFLYAFATIADPHIAATPDHEERLEAFVDWANDNADALDLAYVVVLGDIGWGEGLYTSAAMLDQLLVPYAPVMGDNEVAYGQESDFGDAFAAAFDRLDTTFEDFERPGGTVWDPDLERDLHLANFAFTHQGVRFLGLDWASRDDDTITSEMGDLHDMSGGTLEWLGGQLEAWTDGPNGSVMLMSHIPMAMTVGGFFKDDQARLEAALEPYAGQIPFDYAGHLHVDVDLQSSDGSYDVFVCDALWDDDMSFRVVEVWGNSEIIETVETRYTL